MKKLGKLRINHNKVLKSNELVNLRGGQGNNNNTFCFCASSLGGDPIISGYLDSGCSCDPAYMDRWIIYNCWQEHWSYSGCYCDPCV